MAQNKLTIAQQNVQLVQTKSADVLTEYQTQEILLYQMQRDPILVQIAPNLYQSLKKTKREAEVVRVLK